MTILFRLFSLCACSLFCAFSLPSSALAQPPAAGSISGRVFNPVTREFVRNAEVRIEGSDRVAYTEDGGYYRFDSLPAGEIALVTRYAGYAPAIARVTVVAGRAIQRDFDLTPQERALALEALVVAADREGNAKAVMDQRASINARNVIASDNFGDITLGTMGEFVKYVPGIVLDYSETDARGARIGGLDPKYTAVTMDGNRMASSQGANFNADSRGVDLEQVTIHNIAAIEVSKTLTPSMDADAAAGSINLRTKNALERKGRLLSFQLNAVANSYALTLGKTPGPDDALRRKIFPGGQLEYSDIFFNGRLGVHFTAGSSTIYTEQLRQNTTYDYSNAARGPVITVIAFRPGPKLTGRSNGSLNLDYKLAPNLILSLRSTRGRGEDEFVNRNFRVRANVGDINTASTLTRVVANPTANANTRLETDYSRREKLTDSISFAPKFEYRGAGFTLNGGGSYSRSRARFVDARNGNWSQVNMRLTRMSWMAERDSESSPAWRLTQLTGASWSDIDNFNRSDTYNNNVVSREFGGQNQQFLWNLDAKKTFRLGLPVELKTGVKSRLTTFDISQGNQNYTYIGPTGNQLHPTSAILPETVYSFDPRKGDNVGSLRWPYPNLNAMYALFLEHPEYFRADTVANFSARFIGPRGIKEQIDATYLEAGTRWKNLRLIGGLRYEATRTAAKIWDPLPDRTVTAAGYTSGTIPFVVYKYRNGQRSLRHGDYDNVFASGAAKYNLTPNLTAQLAFSDSIQRPNYPNLAGATTIDENNRIVSVPNPELRPELSTKYFIGLQYQLEPAGTLAVSYYLLDLENAFDGRRVVSQAEAGFAGDDTYDGYTFSTFTNSPVRRRNRGLDFEYSQQLVFLPGALRGLSVFGSLTRVFADQRDVGLVPKAANGGVRFRASRFNLQLRSTWTAAKINSFNANNEVIWTKERLMFDLSGGVRLSTRFELTLSGRNILNAPLVFFSNVPGRVSDHYSFGSVWTLGIKGTF